jgi:hypothetical protein
MFLSTKIFFAWESMASTRMYHVFCEISGRNTGVLRHDAVLFPPNTNFHGRPWWAVGAPRLRILCEEVTYISENYYLSLVRVI